MNTLHHWFRSGHHSLLAHLDLPKSIRADCAVLMVSPFGWEDVCSYRPLRLLGGMFASHGIPAMRFDLPGTGDSSGDARDPELFDAWVRSVGDAAEELRASAGVSEVAVMGIRMGAMLALTAANRGANIQDLILWSPSASGRAVVRELYAFSKLARAEYSNGAPSPPPPLAGLEAGGFLLTPDTQRALDALDLSVLAAVSARRVLLLSRDHLPAEQKLAAALRASGCTVETQNGDGYARMMAIPEEAVAPTETGRAIIEFLLRSPQTESERFVTLPAKALSTAIETGHGATVEEIYQVEHRRDSLFGVLSRPRPPLANPDWCVLFLNPGAVRHIGPNRMWVEAARRLAARGVSSLRLDLQGIGESDGPVNRDVASLYQDRLVKQVEAAMASLRSNIGARRFALVGLCSGAFWAFHAAIRNPEIRAAILLNPRLFFWDPEVDPRRVLRRTARLMTESTDWRRLLRGYVSVATFKRVSRTIFERVRASCPSAQQPQIWPEGMAHAWSALERNQTRMTIIFTEGEPLLREMQEEGHFPPLSGSRVRCIRLANCGHTFRPLWAQKSAHELIDRELDAIFKETGIVESSPDMEYLST